MSAVYSEEIKEAAKKKFNRGLPVQQIASELNINSARVVYLWIEKYGWTSDREEENQQEALIRRSITLIEKPNKTDADFKELEWIFKLQDKAADIELKNAKIQNLNKSGDPSQARQDRNHGRRLERKSKKNKKNDIGSITDDELDRVRNGLFWKYQLNWYAHKDERTRFILKSRQVGATYYFAWEAFEDAVRNGDNQVFLSASKNQAAIFKRYIVSLALEHFDVEIAAADHIQLKKDGKPHASLHFVSTNIRTAQGYNGHLYVDEVFWIPDFDKLNNLAGAMASHKKWHKTYFSIPSMKSHGAYPMWSGERYNENTNKDIEFDLSHATLKKGHRGQDDIWRNIVTIKDAEEQRCDLFDIDKLRIETSRSTFSNLYMCAFVEAGLSVFNFNNLLAAAVDSNTDWADFKPDSDRPYSNYPVWIGYDPARVGDKSTVVVIAPPLKPGGKYRVLEKHHLKGAYRYQAEQIKAICDRYNVAFMGVDVTGPGIGVLDEVSHFYLNVTPIHYSLDTKTRLVLKAVDIVSSERIQWDAEHKEIPQAFLQVRQVTTSNDQITYAADRNSKTGHADVAWAIMNALYNEPLSGEKLKTTIIYSE